MHWTRRATIAGGLTALAPAVVAQATDTPAAIRIAKSGHVLAPVTLDGQASYALLDNMQFSAIGVDAPNLSQRHKREINNADKDAMYVRLTAPPWHDIGNARVQLSQAARGLSAFTQANGVPVDMILGSEVFEQAVVELDFLAQTIVFHGPRKFADPDKAMVFESKVKTPGRFTLPIELGDEVKGAALVSTGFGGIIRVSHAKVGAWINDGRLVWDSDVTTVFGSVTAKGKQVTFRTPPLKVGPYVLGEVVATADPGEHDGVDGVLGVTALRPFRVWFDGSRNRMWLRVNTA